MILPSRKELLVEHEIVRGRSGLQILRVKLPGVCSGKETNPAVGTLALVNDRLEYLLLGLRQAIVDRVVVVMAGRLAVRVARVVDHGRGVRRVRAQSELRLGLALELLLALPGSVREDARVLTMHACECEQIRDHARFDANVQQRVAVQRRRQVHL